MPPRPLREPDLRAPEADARALAGHHPDRLAVRPALHDRQPEHAGVERLGRLEVHHLEHQLAHSGDGMPIRSVHPLVVRRRVASAGAFHPGRARRASRPYFTDLDAPVFGLVNLPETTKAALFARYSRYPGTLRRLFLDEFADSLPESPPAIRRRRGARAARELFERVFVGYGDDSVAQLGGAHIACEWVSNVLTKVLQRPRLGAYLEQSTRYIRYDRRCPAAATAICATEALGPEYARGDGLPVRHLRRAAAARCRRGSARRSRTTRARPPSRARAGHPGQGAGPAARAAARRVALAHGHLRHRPDLRAARPAPARASAAGGARVRRADADGAAGR